MQHDHIQKSFFYLLIQSPENINYHVAACVIPFNTGGHQRNYREITLT